MMMKTLILLLAGWYALPMLADDKSKSGPNEVTLRTTWVKDTVMIRQEKFNAPADSIDGAGYWPAPKYAAGIGVSWKMFSVSYNKAQRNSKEDDAKYGKSDVDNTTFTLNFPWLSFELYKRHMKGMYLSNIKDIDPTWTEDQPYPQRPDISLDSKGVGLTFVTHPNNFSLPELLDQSEYSGSGLGFSFLVKLNANQDDVAADAPLLPESRRGEYGTDANITGLHATNVGLTGGFGFNVNLIGLYLGGYLLFGPAWEKYSLTGSMEDQKQDVIKKLDVGISLGFNIKRFFLGLKLTGSENFYDGEVSQVAVDSALSELFIGTRIF